MLLSLLIFSLEMMRKLVFDPPVLDMTSLCRFLSDFPPPGESEANSFFFLIDFLKGNACLPSPSQLVRLLDFQSFPSFSDLRPILTAFRSPRP